MTIRLYDSLKRQLRPFESLEPGRVRMYTCGPTVYDRAHVGNFRSFLWEDLLRRFLKYKGYEVEQVMNLTDVDDRTIAAALGKGVSLEEITDPVIETFLEDWDTLGLEEPEHRPRATAHVDGMIELIERLEERGYAYESAGSIYFAIERMKGYGRLAGVVVDVDQRPQRTAGDEEYDKENPRDFVLWKGGGRGSEAEVAQWDSPWGPGRPGWHLECSAMAMEYLGETLDIHTGGVDNLFPHHTNEIAQSEGATGEPFSNFWLHAEHLLVEGEKMSKSLGNCFTIPDLVERGHPPSAIRYLLLGGHYRTMLNFTFAGLQAAERAVDRVYALYRRLLEAVEAGTTSAADCSEVAERALAEFDEAMSDDLNVSEALAAVFGLVRSVNQLLDRTAPTAPLGSDKALHMLGAFDQVFGVISLRSREAENARDAGLLAWAKGRVVERDRARANRDWGTADAIRHELEEKGITVEDIPGATRLHLASRTEVVSKPTPPLL